MYDVILFGGTTEGRLLGEFLCDKGIPALVCVATAYGDSLLDLRPPVEIRTGRMDQEEMRQLFRKERPRLVLDATHPYADIVSKNIQAACSLEGCRYQRIRREATCAEGCLFFDTMDELVAWLNKTHGVIFSAMGAKEAAALCSVSDYKSRIYLRLLPSPEGIAHCLELGYPTKHLYCMQGPFSEEFNVAQFRQAGAAILITKESGLHGGFPEKAAAARACEMQIAVLKRPLDADGISPQAAMELLQEICL